MPINIQAMLTEFEYVPLIKVVGKRVEEGPY